MSEPAEQVPFVSKQNLKVRSPKDSKDQTAKNSLEGESHDLLLKCSDVTSSDITVCFSVSRAALLYKPVDRVTRSTLVLHVRKNILY